MSEPTELSKIISYACDDCGGFGSLIIRQGAITSVQPCDCVIEPLSTGIDQDPTEPLEFP